MHSGLSCKNHINAQKVVLRKLKGYGIPVLTPLNTKTGSYFSKLYNRFVQLTPFVEGIPFQFSKEQAYKCGNILRKFHDALMDEKEIPTPFWSNYPSCEVLKKGMDRLKEQQRELHEPFLIKEVEKIYQTVMEQWLPKANSLTKLIIHADWHPWNVLFDNDNGKIYP
ncbi:phosphotransferase family enzyme [Anoxybacillus vitaminiphilus]|uniref:Phosphotransferase family enzyme n=1 Tax=Paranoxybacillus vitaminiphilus TaxID=581036 RepID=A0A327Y0F3_9BACL|nr:phosphotransferase family enzyme [Anoxybacillus vitaminiphilus]